MGKDSGIVNIHGKEYSTVAKRVSDFRDVYKQDLSIVTELVERDEQTVVMKASILKGDQVLATGYAEENRASSTINRTSALENAETSAVGRALAAFGMAGTEYASADEVAQAISQQGTRDFPERKLVLNSLASPKQKQLINDKLNQKGIADEDKKNYLLDNYGITGELSKEDASMVIDDLIEGASYARK